MSVKFNCPHCQEQLAVNECYVGTEIKCPYCGERTMAVPGAVDESESDPECVCPQDYSDENLDNHFDPNVIKTYFLPSVFVCLFCCMPFGIVAIVFAALTEAYIEEKKEEEARRCSMLAKKWFRTGILWGIAYIVIWLFFVMQIMQYR